MDQGAAQRVEWRLPWGPPGHRPQSSPVSPSDCPSDPPAALASRPFRSWEGLSAAGGCLLTIPPALASAPPLREGLPTAPPEAGLPRGPLCCLAPFLYRTYLSGHFSSFLSLFVKCLI